MSIVLIDLDLNYSLFFFFFFYFIVEKNVVQFLACGTGSVGTVGNVGEQVGLADIFTKI